jgi:hypothetical protein
VRHGLIHVGEKNPTFNKIYMIKSVMLLRKSWGAHWQFKELLKTFWECIENIKDLKIP